MLWQQFAMANVPGADQLDLEYINTRRIDGCLLFIDATKPRSAAPGLQLPFPNPFSSLPSLFGGAAGPAPPLDLAALLEVAESRGAVHCYVLADSDAAAESGALLEGAGRSGALRLTLLAPEDGIALRSTAGWTCGQLQDHEGVCWRGMST